MVKRLAMALVLLAGCFASAQIGLKLESNNASYLRYEAVRLRVTLTNLSGNTLIFGGDAAHESGSLVFNVTSLSGRHVRNLDLRANPLSNVIMAPGESKVLYVRLNTMFDLNREDTYTVTAVASHNRMDSRYKSNTLTLEIRDGMVEDERLVGLPAANANDKIRKMRFVLVRFRDVSGYLYCLRAEDDRKVYGTFRIAPYIMGGMKPQMELENGNTLHVLLQCAPRLYSYTTYSIGKSGVKQRQDVYYSAMGGNPRLSRETGFLKVHNVRLAQKGKDYNRAAPVPFGDEE